MKWNANLYDQKHDFVSKYGEGVIELLDPKEEELILDLGCGTGDLAELIRKKGSAVIGLDSSVEMIETARKKYPDIQFDIQSADDFHYDQIFDAVFSNATLHWVLEAEKVVRCIYQALKPGGRLVAEFGGKGNVANIVNALKIALANNGYEERAQKPVWYFPSLAAYATLLEQNGFRVVHASHFDRPTHLKGDNGIQNWLQQFGQPYLHDVNPELMKAILNDVESEIRPTNFKEGSWYADYVRLRVVAIKQP